MSLSRLRDVYIYIGSPFTHYVDGHDAAWMEVCEVTGRLQDEGLDVFSPIVHGHALVLHGGLRAVDHEHWSRVNEKHMDRADVCLVVKMDGWRESDGISEEVEYFREAGKPVLYIDPDTLQVGDAP